MTDRSLDQRRYALGYTIRQLADVAGLPFRDVQLVLENERASMRTAKILDETLTRLEAEEPAKPAPKPRVRQAQPDHHHFDDSSRMSPSALDRAERMWAEGFARIGRNYAGPLRSAA